MNCLSVRFQQHPKIFHIRLRLDFPPVRMITNVMDIEIVDRFTNAIAGTDHSNRPTQILYFNKNSCTNITVA